MYVLDSILYVMVIHVCTGFYIICSGHTCMYWILYLYVVSYMYVLDSILYVVVIHVCTGFYIICSGHTCMYWILYYM